MGNHFTKTQRRHGAVIEFEKKYVRKLIMANIVVGFLSMFPDFEFYFGKLVNWNEIFFEMR